MNLRNFRRETPLHLASNKLVVRLLLEYGADISAKTSKTPLHYRAREGHIDLVRDLLQRAKTENKLKECINAKDENGVQPIHLAAKEGHKDVIDYLVGLGAAVNAKDNSDIQPIHLAAREGHKDSSILIEREGSAVDIKAEDKSGMQPIHLAAREG